MFGVDVSCSRYGWSDPRARHESYLPVWDACKTHVYLSARTTSEPTRRIAHIWAMVTREEGVLAALKMGWLWL